MIEKIGIGIDIVDVTRFEKIPYEKKPGFYKKIFLQSEIEYCLQHVNPHMHFAGKFAVKEAVKKSIKKNISLLDIETSHSDSMPTIKLKGNENYQFLVSISHENTIAVGVVISERIT